MAWAAQAKAACPAPRIRYRRTLAEASQDERPRVAARPAQRTTLRGQHQTPPAFGGPEPHPPPAAGVPLPSSHPRRRSSTAGTTALPRRSTMGRPRRRSTTAQPRRCALRLSMVDVHLMEILLPATDSALGGNEIVARRPRLGKSGRSPLVNARASPRAVSARCCARPGTWAWSAPGDSGACRTFTGDQHATPREPESASLPRIRRLLATAWTATTSRR